MTGHLSRGFRLAEKRQAKDEKLTLFSPILKVYQTQLLRADYTVK